MALEKVGLLAFVAFVAILVGQVPQAWSLSCYACYSVNGSDRRCDDPMIRMYNGIIEPVECALPENQAEEENITVVSDEQGPKYDTEVKETDTGPVKPWSMRSTYCVKMIGISGNFEIVTLGLFRHIFLYRGNEGTIGDTELHRPKPGFPMWCADFQRSKGSRMHANMPKEQVQLR